MRNEEADVDGAAAGELMSKHLDQGIREEADGISQGIECWELSEPAVLAATKAR